MAAESGTVPSPALLRGRVAAAPISWGVCEVPGWGHVLPLDDVLGEMASLGIVRTELGPPGFLPDDPGVLRAVLNRHGLGLVGGFLAAVLHDEMQVEATLGKARRACAQLAAGGGEVLVLAAATGLGGYDERPALTDVQWATLVTTVATIRDAAAEHGLRACLHPHVGTHVERAAEVERFLADSDLPLCLDTGHLLLGGIDLLRLTRTHSDRISHVHLKDVDAVVAERVRSGEITYQQAVQADLYVPLGDGDVPVAEIVRMLESAGFDGWYVLEQDTALVDDSPVHAARPLRDVRRSLAHLASVRGSGQEGTIPALSVPALSVPAPSVVPVRPEDLGREVPVPPLLEMTRTTPTCLWNDSADLVELSRSLSFGGVGATCNPVITLAVIKRDLATWQARIEALAAARPTASEDEIGWRIVEELSVAAARLLEQIFETHRGRNGRVSLQTDPRLHRDAEALVEQAVRFHGLAPNIIVKIPATSAGVEAIEEATYRGVSTNATVSFTVPQALAVGEAVERGLCRREAAGLDVATMGPVCTIMVGRLDDWMRVSAERVRAVLDPRCFEWAGVAVFKRAYALYQERGYRTRLLSAAFRNHRHWSELVGGDIVISPPFDWQLRFNASDIRPVPRIDVPVASSILDTLYAKLPEFRRAYDADGLSVAEFDSYGATRRTLRQFLAANAELAALVRDVVVPDPDR
jgi:transaldolase